MGAGKFCSFVLTSRKCNTSHLRFFFNFKKLIRLVFVWAFFIFMEFIFPAIGRKVSPGGIYRMQFDDGNFYIGSSKDLKTRLRAWRNMIKLRKYLKNINIKNVIDRVSVVSFSIIEFHTNTQEMIERETELLKTHWENPLLLNRCADADYKKGTLGMRPYRGYIKRKYIQKYKPRTGPKSLPQKIARFDLEWNLLEIHPSKHNVRKRFHSCRHNAINQFLKGLKGQVGGFKFKLVSESGEFIEPIINIKKSKKDNPTVPKFYQLDFENNIVGEFFNITVAARAVKGNRTHVTEVLNEVKYNKTVKGFVFMFADKYHKKYG